MSCVPASAPACVRDDGGNYTRRCNDDGRPTYCAGSIELAGLRCSDLGLACASGTCLGTEGSCASFDDVGVESISYAKGISCSGGILKACVGKGVTGGISSVPCTQFSPAFTCQEIVRQGAIVPYCGLGSACDAPSRRNLTCEGDSVVVCNAGRIDKIDCKSLGFAGCNAQAGGCIPNLYTRAGLVDGG